MRNITIFTTVGSRRQTIESEATIWSELQDDLDMNDVQYYGLKAIVSSTQNTLESSEATLPEGDFTLMLMPTKVKSGGDYDDMRFNDLRRLANVRGLDIQPNPTKQQVIDALVADDDDDYLLDDSELEEVDMSLTSPSYDFQEESATIDLEPELTSIESAISSIRLKLANTPVEIREEIDPEIAALQREAAAIQENLNN